MNRREGKWILGPSVSGAATFAPVGALRIDASEVVDGGARGLFRHGTGRAGSIIDAVEFECLV